MAGFLLDGHGQHALRRDHPSIRGMADGEPPAAPGQHALGPHVVGQRVVVRSIVPGETGPTGGPALTDVLGVCLSWADGVATLQREDGSTVDVETRLIVSGKPVPPRPPVRHRVTVAAAEARTAALFADLETVSLGDWVLRHERSPAGRRRKRGSSCLALGDPGVDLNDALGRVERWYAERDLPALLQTEADGDVDRAAAELGWSVVEGGEAHHLLGSVSRALRAVRRLGGASAEPTVETLRTDGDVVHLRASLDDGAGEGLGCLDGDHLGLHGLRVAPERRRSGLGTALVAALLEAGAERGTTTVWLHVETDNAAAYALYERLGLTVHHTMRYRRPVTGR
ncbi:hypothetical protein GCM10027425_30650 [Alteromonas gracilis]